MSHMKTISEFYKHFFFFFFFLKTNSNRKNKNVKICYETIGIEELKTSTSGIELKLILIKSDNVIVKVYYNVRIFFRQIPLKPVGDLFDY